MKASIIDLRYKMKDVLNALERNETVEILYHGKLKGIISPIRQEINKKVIDHPYFGIQKKGKSVLDQMDQLRGGRYRDL